MGKRRGTKQESGVARAVRAVGGPTKAAVLCGVSNTAIHDWIRKGHVSLLKHAVRLSRASQVPIDDFLDEKEDDG
jgi:DNA-binding transcriptional regulator YdaS (Cro superfamily)